MQFLLRDWGRHHLLIKTLMKKVFQELRNLDTDEKTTIVLKFVSPTEVC